MDIAIIGVGRMGHGRPRGPNGDKVLLMSSTPFAYPQVVSRTFALFRVAIIDIPAGHS